MTAQVPDRINYQGEALALLSNPLESYAGPEEKKLRFRPINTANWRGYVASWEVSEDTLYLVGVSATYANGSTPILKEIFGDVNEQGRVMASWFSGELRIARGKVVHYVHMGYHSTFEQEIFLTVEDGVVTDIRVEEN